jgi:hypothetical protein
MKIQSGVIVLALMCNVIPAQTVTSPVSYHGGPVLESFTIYPLFWGNWSKADMDAQFSYMQALAAYISGQGAPLGQQPVIWQYGVKNVAVAPYQNTFLPVIAGTGNLSDNDIRSIIHFNQNGSAASAKLLPAYGPNTLIFVFPSRNVDCQGCGGYHHSEATGSYYAIAQPYPADPTGRNEVVSHEVFESATDPDGQYPWVEPRGGWAWWGPDKGLTGSNAIWQEVSDFCNGIDIPNVGRVAQVHDNTQGGACSSTGYMRPVRASVAADPAAYVRSDATNSVVYRGTDSHVHELYLSPHGSNWQSEDLSILTNAPAYAGVAGRPVPYVRFDGTSSVIYRGADNHLFEVLRSEGPGCSTPCWWIRDLTVLSGAPAAASDGDPAAYVRFDGVSSVVYRAANNAIYEIYILPGSTSPQYGAPLSTAPPAAGSPAGYIRYDGVNCIVYRGTDSHLYELSLGQNGWQLDDLFSKVGASAVTAAGDPVAFVRSDLVSSIVYLGTDNHVHAITYTYSASRLGSGGGPGITQGPWGTADLTVASGAPNAAGDPSAYVRLDNTNSVVYRGADNHIHEIYLVSGSTWKTGANGGDLFPASSTPATPPAAGHPAGYRPGAYRRADNVNSLVYRGTDAQIHELYLLGGSSNWQAGNPVSGAPAAQ